MTLVKNTSNQEFHIYQLNKRVRLNEQFELSDSLYAQYSAYLTKVPYVIDESLKINSPVFQDSPITTQSVIAETCIESKVVVDEFTNDENVIEEVVTSTRKKKQNGSKDEK